MTPKSRTSGGSVGIKGEDLSLSLLHVVLTRIDGRNYIEELLPRCNDDGAYVVLARTIRIIIRTEGKRASRLLWR